MEHLDVHLQHLALNGVDGSLQSKVHNVCVCVLYMIQPAHLCMSGEGTHACTLTCNVFLLCPQAYKYN